MIVMGHQHGGHFIVLGQQDTSCYYIMSKHSIVACPDFANMISIQYQIKFVPCDCKLVLSLNTLFSVVFYLHHRVLIKGKQCLVRKATGKGCFLMCLSQTLCPFQPVPKWCVDYELYSLCKKKPGFEIPVAFGDSVVDLPGEAVYRQ